ncbi:hypothetical protein A3711_15860 [Erythrobacter sp. HI00D59]|nr:hypothetical protein A3711_15860 [Erythrobacter sp. HI00D59]
MWGIVADVPGGPERLKTVAKDRPAPESGEVLVGVMASGVSRPDSLQRQGMHPPPPGITEVLGLEVAGTVEAVGSAVTGFAPGDRVCALLSGGGYAEYAIAPVGQVLPIPEGWSFVEAATLPENMFTVYDNLFTRARLSAEETLLVQGGAGGIGSTAIMLAKEVGATVIATAGTEEKRDFCRSLGADYAIDYRVDVARQVEELTGGRGVDVAIDIMGGSSVQASIDMLALDGRCLLIASQGNESATISIGSLMRVRGAIMASSMRPRGLDEKARIGSALLRDVWPAAARRTHVRPVIDSVFAYRDVVDAHARLDAGLHAGKIVLSGE